MPKTAVAAALLALALTSPAHAQEIEVQPGPDLLQTLGDFVRSGLAPPRTAADLAREEEKARQARMAAPPPAEPPADPEPVAAPVAAPLPEPVPAPVVAEPAPIPPPPVAAPQPKPAAAPVVVAPAPRPKPIVVPRPEAEPVRAADRIAGTATLDQAIKLGGPVELYTRRPPKPAGD